GRVRRKLSYGRGLWKATKKTCKSGFEVFAGDQGSLGGFSLVSFQLLNGRCETCSLNDYEIIHPVDRNIFTSGQDLEAGVRDSE
ncbi:hypothetical protein LINGRAHAP2_LOCUS6266, partial [Linum grandiflorum]